MQSLPLGEKVNITQTRLFEWYIKNNNQCYVSFSGGKDSTVLAYLAAQVCESIGCKLVLWFSDTGLEYPEVRSHVKSYGNFLKSRFPKLDVEVIMDFPKDRKGNRIIFRDVILKFGYPIVSKEVSAVIKNARSAYANGKEANNYAVKQLNGEYVSSGTGKKCFNKEKWKFLVDAPFGISNYCCSVFKKNPAKKFSKHSGLKPIIGTMASESSRRRTTWLRYGCNAFNATAPSSKPLSFWLENDVLEFIVRYDLPYPSVYGEIVQDKKGKYRTTGLDRTGCVFCGYGCHLEKEPNRFQRLKVTHPKLWNYCMKPVENGGLGMREVLEYIGVKVE